MNHELIKKSVLNRIRNEAVKQNFVPILKEKLKEERDSKKKDKK